MIISNLIYNFAIHVSALIKSQFALCLHSFDAHNHLNIKIIINILIEIIN